MCCFYFQLFKVCKRETTERRLHWIELIPLSMFIDCVTRVSRINQSVVLHLLGGQKFTDIVYEQALCIMDRPVKEQRRSSGWVRESEAGDGNGEGRLRRDTMHKVRLMTLNKGEMENELFLYVKKKLTYQENEKRKGVMQVNSVKVSSVSEQSGNVCSEMSPRWSLSLFLQEGMFR